MRLTIDENLPPSWCEFLTQEGYETHHWKGLGSCGDPDDLILDYAQAHQTIIYRRASYFVILEDLKIACPHEAAAPQAPTMESPAEARRRRVFQDESNQNRNITKEL